MTEAGKIAFGWWAKEIGPRDHSGARALAARLRRAAPLAVLSEPAVQQLASSLGFGPQQASELIRLVVLLAEVRENSPQQLIQRLGGEDAVLSPLRFQRLIRAEGSELTDQLRRAIAMADRRCNVAALATDILQWHVARARWCFLYFGAEALDTAIEGSSK